jgi:cysteinyl-tRNA synthetase
MKYLGETFDLHTGGIDNLFPHHENEIAQAEASTGKEFVKTWMHCAHLKVNGEKMSKSAGNFFTLRDLIEKGWSGREIRYVLVNAHYRQGLNFAFSALEDARKSLARIDTCVEAIEKLAAQSAAADAPEFASKALEDFSAAVNDDLNIPKDCGAGGCETADYFKESIYKVRYFTRYYKGQSTEKRQCYPAERHYGKALFCIYNRA